jgi:hypothetical protein
LAERRVSASLVIEHFDVVEQLHLGFTAAGKRSAVSLLTDEKNASITALS